jgi:transcriptional regulator with XRE-family HTH domain
MKQSRIASYLSSHRKRSGLSQERLGRLLGYPDEGPVSRHERLCSVPPLRIALGYQAIFQIPISELFPGEYERIKQDVEERLAELERTLQQSSEKGRSATRIARTLEWLWERPNHSQIPLTHDTELF